jgi:hypothetical protein
MALYDAIEEAPAASISHVEPLIRPSTPAAGRGAPMAAMKPRTGDGPLEVTKEGRGIVMRVPLEGGGRLVVELNKDEATALGDALKDVVG